MSIIVNKNSILIYLKEYTEKKKLIPVRRFYER